MGNIKPVGRNVLIKETFTKRTSSKIILPGQVDKTTDATYDAVRVLTEVGPEVPESYKVGSTVHLVSYAEPMFIKDLTGKVGDQLVERISAYPFDNIVVLEEQD